MKIEIAAPHMEMTPAIVDAVHKKTERLAKHSEKELRIHVTLGVANNEHKVEMVVNDGKTQFIAKTSGPDMYAGINEATKMIDRQWRKKKTARLADRVKEPSIKRLGM